MRRLLWLAYLLTFALVVAVAAEYFQRAIEPDPTRYFMFPPNTERTFHIWKDIVNGVAPVGHFVVNGYGLRGRPPADEPHRILVLGGSTVEQLLQDEPNVWTAQLDRMIGEFSGSDTTWVGNAGRSGLTSFENIIQMRHLPDMVSNIRTVIVLLGCNDIAYGYTNASRPEREVVPDNVRYGRTFWVVQSPEDRFPYNLALYRLYLSVKRLSSLASRGHLQTGGTDTQYMNWLVSTRAKRKALLPHRDELPDLQPYLDAYRNNLDQMIDIANARGLDLIFVTQPLMYRPDQSAAEESIYGSLGLAGGQDAAHPAFHYSSAAMRKMEILYHQATLETCQTRRITCIDAAARMPPTIDNYYDGLHFTDAGNLALARFVFEGLRDAGKLTRR